ncbi:MAG: peptidoglycan DD-metalloendopeptidase family protein [Bacillota bacterium]
MKCAVALLLAATLAGCAGALQWNSPQEGPPIETAPTSYTVKPGDDVYAIAWRYGLDYHDVASWNHLGRDYRIHPGDNLVLRAPTSAQHKPPVTPVTHVGATGAASPPSSGPVQWSWPVDGQVVREFHPGSRLAKGIDITAPRGTEIHAAAGGRVVYAGSGIIGYGKLIIIKNSETLLSAYADNDALLVKEGDNVRAGDRIAVMGVGRDNRPVLHFEIRYDGNPVDPLGYLPKR